jgi:hypothetical protein
VDASDFGLAVIPPVLAMVVEWLNPLTDEHVLGSARIDLEQYQRDKNHDLLTETVALSTSAAVEIAGLSPTIVSAITSGFAIIHSIPHPFWYTIGYVLIFVAIALGLLRMLAGRTFHQIRTTRPVIRWWGKDRQFPWFRTKIVSSIIYLSNFVLVILATSTYLSLGGWSEILSVFK